MIITNETIIGELVAYNYHTASVFKEYEIDFCCNGHRSIAEACREKQTDSEKLIEKLSQLQTDIKKPSIDYDSWPLDLLADYIEKKHHRFVESKIQEITPLLEKIVQVHGERHPELPEVKQLFSEAAGELTVHMKKEEFILFPYVRKMIQAQNGGNTSQPSFGTVKNPIRMMMHEHDNEGERFRKIARLTQNYTPPEDACNTYKVTYALLKEFEEDLHLHIHLENNILFPKSVAAESHLLV